jgi:hypothetical protein
MREILALIITVTFLTIPAFADRKVRGYTKKDGTVVQPHRRTNTNKTETDNYSTKGNSNPYSGKKGTKTAER